ncbi:phosphotransferase family protein [Devosia geojensis]|uniref:phosphotransferase family protein n=1 Tax=Devosia geojensis TaxID=443610 RepID=UPI0006970DFD|nr:aminoglycoside phosphotransferase family protein [Devosia geojensis]
MRPAVEHGALVAELKRLLGGTVSLTPVSEGEESRAFGLSADGEELILRLHPTGDGYAKDAFAARSFGSADLPIPKVIDYGILDAGLHYCLSQRAPGRTLQDLDTPELEPVLQPVARVMEAMARTDVGAISGFGRFDAQGRGAHESWRAHLRAITDSKKWREAYEGGVPERVVRLLDLVSALADGCPETHGLVHGDFGSNNVIAENGRITGVIDWSEAMVGDPLYDVANIFFWRPWLDCMEQQARFFERERPDVLADARLACYQLRIGLEVLLEALIDKDERVARWALTRCETVASGR